ncbi:hypothetical protein [Micromonospora echinospora]
MPKHARRLDGFKEAILSLYTKGLTTGEISAPTRGQSPRAVVYALC